MLRTGVVQVGAERTTIFAAVDSNQMERIIIEVQKTSYGGGYLSGCTTTLSPCTPLTAVTRRNPQWMVSVQRCHRFHSRDRTYPLAGNRLTDIIPISPVNLVRR